MYAELHCHSWFSLLDGAESPAALVARAAALGLRGLALTDHDSLAGAIQFTKAAQSAGLHAIVGAEITLDGGQLACGAHLTLLAENPRGYANLCRILTRAHTGAAPADPADWPGKTPPAVPFDFVAAHGEGLIVLSGCRRGAVAAVVLQRDLDAVRARAAQLREAFGPAQVWIELQHHRLPDDDRLVRGLVATARALDLPLVATQNAHYADAGAARLRDALIAIDHNIPLAEARRAGHLPFNHDYALCGADAMQHRFRELPEAIANTLAIAERCQVSLDFSDRRTPAFPAPDGQSEFAYLYALCHEGLPRRYPQLKPAVLNQLAHELSVIEQAGLAGYFLVVWDIVRFARERGVRCQGRGSAANSLVAYLLGITAVDPLAHDLLFERFLSADRYTTPDIDLDFAADRREEVIRYVYDRYGAAHTAMVCNLVTYQARSAVRDLAKALDFPAPVIERLAKELDTHSCARAADALAAQAAAPDAGTLAVDGASQTVIPRAEHPLSLLADLVRRIDDCPRHLSIHVGGMLITAQPLDEVVPLERATMPGRVVCQWNKDSVEDAGLIKIDLLALRTLGLISEALGYLAAPPDLDALTLDDPHIYAMLQRGDTLGTFQVESRAQQQMLPRLRPERFADIVVEVAIVRPGPIQGGAVHPYLRRRDGLEPVTYLHPSLEPVLRETLGVLLFQEQAIRVAMAAAHFGPGEADLLRRSLSRSDTAAIEGPWRERFTRGAAANGIDGETAAAIFDQLAGFAGYGFCKSHAASFALIAYQTMHLKAYHPAAFYCALLNQQPMGFYRPEVIIGDARRHGVRLLPSDINRSDWRYTVEGERKLRAGLQAVSELGETAWARIAPARAEGPFADLRDLCARTRLSHEVVANLIRAGACDTLGDRRALLWALGGIDIRPEELPLDAPPMNADLPVLTDTERTAWEYELMGLSAHGQALRHLRGAFNRAGLASTAEVKALPGGRIVRTAGMVVVRQRPQTAKGMVFMSLEDEFGLLDVVFRPDVYERCRKSIRGQTVILVDGELQKASGAISVLAHRARGWEE